MASLVCVASILTSNFAFSAVIDNSSESKFAGVQRSSSAVSNNSLNAGAGKAGSKELFWDCKTVSNRKNVICNGSSLLTSHEKDLLFNNDHPVGDTYVFPHELFLGSIVAAITAYWSYKRLTRKRPLF